MRYWTLVFALFIGIMEGSIANPAFLQQPPNFTGHWVQDPRPTPNEEAGPFCGLECNITQDAKVLTVIIRGAPLTGTYKLDGSPETTTSTLSGHTVQMSVTARWDGATLVITRQTGPVGGSPTTGSIARLSLKNGRLVIESSWLSLKDGRLVEDPSGGIGPGRPFVYKLVK